MKPKVIFIVGLAHSGSTVLGMILSAKEKAFFAGEFKYYKKRLTQKNLEDYLNTCSCGKKHDDCPIWSKVDANNLLELVQETSKITESPIIIDSSKSIQDMREYISLYKQGKIDLVIYHIIRYPSAVAYSHQKQGSPFIKALGAWVIRNNLISIYSRGVPKVKIHYEELENFTMYEERMRQTTFHILAGNPMRFKPFTNIRIDTRWKQEIGKPKKVLGYLANLAFI